MRAHWTTLVCSDPMHSLLAVVVAVGKWAEAGAVGNAERCPRQAGRSGRGTSPDCPLIHSLAADSFAAGAPNLIGL